MKKIENLTIAPNRITGGIYGYFDVDGQQYYTDVSLICIGHPISECMIFKSKDNQVVDWIDLYCNRDVEISEESLRRCINEFVESLK